MMNWKRAMMLGAATLLAPATGAQAATYVTYTVGGDAIASAYQVSQTQGYTNTPGWFEAVFTVALTDLRNGNTYYEALDSSSFGFGPTILGATRNALTFERRAQSRATSRIALTACPTSSMGALPITAGRVAVDASCGSASLYVEGIASFGFLNATGTVNSIVVSLSDIAPRETGLSSFVFAVPEPATWILMLAGFGMVGYSLRRRRYRIATA